MIKMEVRGSCVQYRKQKNRARRNAETHLHNKKVHLMNLLNTDKTKENNHIKTLPPQSRI